MAFTPRFGTTKAAGLLKNSARAVHEVLDYLYLKVMKSTEDRVRDLIDLSDKVYRAIDEEAAGNTRAYRIVQLGIQTVARGLEEGYGQGLVAGDQFHSLLLRELYSGGVKEGDYTPWPNYASIANTLPPVKLMSQPDAQLTQLAHEYATVKRLTIDRTKENFETDDSHVVHLAALALPYAAEYYPHLDQSKIAIYCLVHDIVEAYAGDVPSLGASQEAMQQKDVDEAKALQRIDDELREQFPRFVQVIRDYEKLDDDEARYVKTFDKLDPGFTHYYSDGKVLTRELQIKSATEFYTHVDEMTARMKSYAPEFPLLMQDRDTLTQLVAAKTPWPEQ